MVTGSPRKPTNMKCPHCNLSIEIPLEFYPYCTKPEIQRLKDCGVTSKTPAYMKPVLESFMMPEFGVSWKTTATKQDDHTSVVIHDNVLFEKLKSQMASTFTLSQPLWDADLFSPAKHLRIKNGACVLFRRVESATIERVMNQGKLLGWKYTITVMPKGNPDEVLYGRGLNEKPVATGALIAKVNAQCETIDALNGIIENRSRTIERLRQALRNQREKHGKYRAEAFKSGYGGTRESWEALSPGVKLQAGDEVFADGTWHKIWPLYVGKIHNRPLVVRRRCKIVG